MHDGVHLQRNGTCSSIKSILNQEFLFLIKRVILRVADHCFFPFGLEVNTGSRKFNRWLSFSKIRTEFTERTLYYRSFFYVLEFFNMHNLHIKILNGMKTYLYVSRCFSNQSVLSIFIPVG